MECSRYKEVQGRCELQGAPGERVGRRQVTVDNCEGSDLQRGSSQHRGCVRLEGDMKPPVPALPPAVSRAKPGLLRPEAEGGGEGKGGRIWSHIG